MFAKLRVVIVLIFLSATTNGKHSVCRLDGVPGGPTHRKHNSYGRGDSMIFLITLAADLCRSGTMWLRC